MNFSATNATEKVNLIMGDEKRIKKPHGLYNKKDTSLFQKQSKDINALSQKLKAKNQGIRFKTINFNKEEDKENTEEDADGVVEKKKNFSFKPIYNLMKIKVRTFLDSIAFILIMLVITLFVLFASDLQSAILPSSIDDFFNTIQLICLFLFIIELLLAILFLDNYNLTFYFWLDLISTLSLVIEINGVMDFILNIFISDSTDVETTETGNSATAGKLSKATKTWKVTRVVRLVRIVRLIRIVKLYKTAMLAKKQIEDKKARMIAEEAKREEENQKDKEKESKFMFRTKKLNDNFILNKKRKAVRDKGKKFMKNNGNNKKNFQQAREERKIEIMKMRENNLIEEFEKNFDENNELFEEKKEEDTKKVKDNEDDDSDEEKENNETNKEEQEKVKDTIAKESNITKIVSQSITKKVIILILGMVVGLPLMEDTVYINTEDNFSNNSIATYLSGFSKNINNTNYDYYFNYLLVKEKLIPQVDDTIPIINITYNDELFYQNKSYINNTLRHGEIRTSFSSDYLVIINYSILGQTSMSGILEIVKTIFIGFLIVYAAVTLENDTKKLVLGPMEIIIEIIELVSTDPIKAKNPENFKTGLKSLVNDIEEEDTEASKKNKLKITQKQQDLEKYEVIKVKESIIKISSLLVVGLGDAGCEMIKNNLRLDKLIDLFVKGKKIKGIFGIASIPNCNDVIEMLNERSILYINKLSEYVHNAVDRFGGSINANHGGDILISWNFRTLKEFKQGKIYNKDVKQMADMALCSVFDSIVAVKTRKCMTDWKFDENVIKIYGRNYEPRLNFALHIGSAIEGITGSYHKLEANYISKNIIILRRVKELANIYGVDIILTDSFYSQLGEDMKELCRLIDIIKFKDNPTYTKIYTVDINKELLPNDEEDIIDKLPQRDKLLKNLAKKERFRKYLNGTSGGKNNKMSSFAFSKQGYKDLLSTTKPADFFRYFDKGINDYLIGDWKSAKLNFEQCQIYDKTDKPTEFLYNYMKKLRFKAPKKGDNKWQGKREIS